jgi:MYXO-CTERM domain-containing protein
MSVADLATRASYQPEIAHPDPDWGHEYNPRVSSDNKWIVYMTSTGCHDTADCNYEIFLHQLGADVGERTRLTDNLAFDGYPDMYVGPLWSKETEPQLRLSPSRVTFYASTSEPPPAVTVKVRSAAGAIPGAIHAAVAPVTPWLSVAIGADSITLRVQGETGLSRGSHPSTVTVTVDGTQAAPMTLPLTVIADDSFPIPDGGAVNGGMDAAADASPAAVDASPAVASASGKGGCSCSLAESSSRGGLVWLIAALVLATVRRRRTPR